MEQEPCPELDAAQARFDEAAELHEQQAVRLQKAVQRKEEAVRKYWDSRIKQADQEKDGKKTPSPVNGRPNARSAEARIAYLLEQYDRRVAEVEKLKSRRNATRQQLDSARNRIQEQITSGQPSAGTGTHYRPGGSRSARPDGSLRIGQKGAGPVPKQRGPADRQPSGLHEFPSGGRL